MNPRNRHLHWRTMLLGALIVLSAAPAFAQRYAGSAQKADAMSASRMKIVNVARPPQHQSSYTIVGAVRQSAVYLTTQPSLRVSQLVEAAGGLNPDASSTLSVIRNGQLRFKIAYDPALQGSDQALQPGDVVVAIPREPAPQVIQATASTTTVPVVCVGLVDRPVVIPLTPEIRQVGELLRRMLQSKETADQVRVLDPFGKVNSTELTAGSVVIFNPATVDHLALRSIPLLPPAVDLDLAPAAAPEPVFQNPTTSVVTIETSVASLPLPAPVAEPIVSAEAPTSPALMIPELPLPASVEPGQLLAAESEEPVHPPSIPALPQLPETSRVLQTADNSLSSSPVVSATTDIPVVEQPLSLEEFVARRSNALPEAEMPFAPEPPASEEQELSLVTAAVNIEDDPSWMRDEFGSASAPTERSSEGSMSSLPIAAMVAFLVIACWTLSIAWARWDRGAAPQVQLEQITATPVSAPLVAPDVEAVPAAPSPPPSPAAGVEAILKRTVPIIEERTQVRSRIPLHGEAVGHRRMILDSAHEAPSGPHFARAESRARNRTEIQSRVQDDERRLRQTLRDAIRPVSEARSPATEITPPERKSPPMRAAVPRPKPVPVPHAPFAAQAAVPDVPQQEDAGAPQYDIIQPEMSQARRSPHSPLDRALHTLASERRG